MKLFITAKTKANSAYIEELGSTHIISTFPNQKWKILKGTRGKETISGLD